MKGARSKCRPVDRRRQHTKSYDMLLASLGPLQMNHQSTPHRHAVPCMIHASGAAVWKPGCSRCLGVHSAPSGGLSSPAGWAGRRSRHGPPALLQVAQHLACRLQEVRGELESSGGVNSKPEGLLPCHIACGGLLLKKRVQASAAGALSAAALAHPLLKVKAASVLTAASR